MFLGKKNMAMKGPGCRYRGKVTEREIRLVDAIVEWVGEEDQRLLEAGLQNWMKLGARDRRERIGKQRAVEDYLAGAW